MITARQASFLDFGALWALKVEMLQQCAEVLPRLTAFGIGVMAHQANGWLLDKDTAVFLAFDGDVPIGFCVIVVGGMVQVGDERTLTGAHFWVKNEYRHTKAGSLLCSRASAVARNFKAASFQVVVRPYAIEVRALLEKHHFEPCGIVYERRLNDG